MAANYGPSSGYDSGGWGSGSGLSTGGSGLGFSSGGSGLGLSSGGYAGPGADYSLNSDSGYGSFSSPDYSLGSGTTQGLKVGYDFSPGYRFNTGTDYGLSPGSYDIGGGLGYGLDYGSTLGPDFGTNDWGLDYGQLSRAQMGGLGLNVAPNPNFGPMGFDQPLGVSAGRTPLSMREEPGFYGSKAHKALSFIAQFNPVTAAASGLYGVFGAPDQKTAMGAALGMVPGPAGMLGRAAYGAYNSPDPGGYLGTQAAGTLGGMVGSAIGGGIAGQAGAQLGGQLGAEGLGGLAATEAARAYKARQDAGIYGSGSPVEAGRAQAQASMAREASQQAYGGGSGRPAERDWVDTALKVGSGLYGMYQGNKQQQQAQQAIAGSAPWTAQGGNAMAGEELQRVIRGDLANDPGFKLAQLSAARAGAQQPGGFAASAAANAALRYQMERMQALGAPAGVGFNPAAGYQTAQQGTQQGINTFKTGISGIAAGMTSPTAGTGMNTMPPWLQQYLINNNMRS